jgi:Ca2+:H+ antiporter
VYVIDVLCLYHVWQREAVLKAPVWLNQLNFLDALLVFVPLTVVGQLQGWGLATFFFACLAMIPLASLMGRATESLSDRVGEGIGALLNATFGNACELIIAFAALRAGFYDIVKASITGSIIGNILLVLGASMLAGGMKYETQTFNRTAATASATSLALAAISLTVPAVFDAWAHSSNVQAIQREDELALGISIVLFIVYLLGLLFSLKTHKHHYASGAAAENAGGWRARTSVIVLVVSTVLVAYLSEILVHRVELAANALHLGRMFIGLVVVAIIGNAAEHSTAVIMARKNKMDLSMGIALGSGTQIALFVAPLLVFLSYFFGPHPMDLNFTTFEVLSIVVSVIILSFVSTDGECNWLEGVQLLATYVILATAFYFA